MATPAELNAHVNQKLDELVDEKSTLAVNLSSNGVEATQDEKFDTLVPKVSNVYEVGKTAGAQSEYDTFWDVFQGGEDSYRDYSYKFAAGAVRSTGTKYACWDSRIYNPKYAMYAKNCEHMFDGSSGYSNQYPITNIKKPIYISTTCNYGQYMFYGCVYLTDIPLLYFEAYTGKTTRSQTVNMSMAFYDCKNLTNVTFGGYVRVNNFSLSSSTKLTHNSLMSLINSLEDVTTNTSQTSWKISLGTTNLAKLTDDEKAIATAKNWTLT